MNVQQIVERTTLLFGN